MNQMRLDPLLALYSSIHHGILFSLFVSQHIERDQLFQMIKIDFLLYPKWLFFHLNFDAKICEIGHCVLEIFQFSLRMSYQINEKLILRKRLLKFGNPYKVLVFWQFRGQFFHEHTVFPPNPSSNLQIKYWRLQNIWNLKINFGTIFWDILTVHPCNSKSSPLTTGTFWYVESHLFFYM